MKITNAPSVGANNEVIVTYTAEPGDPQSFFFEIVVQNSWRQDVAGKQAFSGSGSFSTVPGYVGTHYIEAYDSSAVVGETTPFATGPAYEVLSPGSPPTMVSTPLSSTVGSVTTSKPTQTQGQVPPTKTQGISTSAITTSAEPIGANLNLPGTTVVVESATTTISADRSIVALALTTTTEKEAGVGGTSTGIPSLPQTLSHSRRNIGALIGGTVAGVIGFALLLALCWRWRYRKRHAQFMLEDGTIFSPTVAPFLGFTVPASDEKSSSRKGFVRLSESSSAMPSSMVAVGSHTSMTSMSTISRFSSDTGSLTLLSPVSTRSLDSPVMFAAMPVGTQMEWVLRPTNDPPPGYSAGHV
ncbi:hypothetical protein MIND_00174900 [Mycena indigotica]|uniref:Uncharacterized protein n=1 Tax=Mycena indigotica TaxID=2126181 RepID=A0A8H6TH25_9AGAR|nr:uncharacterized protein MIND_00174900 [Mycena indigotica]KAF7316556.1 hypothetical protein MIND_00174900 [Mycena indigotica]